MHSRDHQLSYVWYPWLRSHLYYCIWCLISSSTGAFSACDQADAAKKLTNGKITWLIADKDDSPGQITCNKKFVLSGGDIAYCVAKQDQDPAYVLMGSCTDDGKFSNQANIELSVLFEIYDHFNGAQS